EKCFVRDPGCSSSSCSGSWSSWTSASSSRPRCPTAPTSSSPEGSSGVALRTFRSLTLAPSPGKRRRRADGHFQLGACRGYQPAAAAADDRDGPLRIGQVADGGGCLPAVASLS